MLENKNEFLAKYQIEDKVYRKAKLKWEDLRGIYDDFTTKVHHLNSIGLSISNTIQVQSGVHSVRYRVKDPEHLIEKIIRKVAENPKRRINLSNYEEEITDLVGVRAIHLFKSNWESIDQFMRETWEFKEDPIAYFRKGDSEDTRSTFNISKFEVKEHKAGYRSLHYIIVTQPTKVQHFVEVQVRTLFEEGWSEIDHKIRYPYDTNNELINSLLMIFNRLAGSADEIGEYVKTLSLALTAKEKEYLSGLATREKEIESLKIQIESLKLKPQQKTKLFQSIDQLTKSQNPFFTGSFGNDLSNVLSSSAMVAESLNSVSTFGGLSKTMAEIKDLGITISGMPRLSDYSINFPVDALIKTPNQEKGDNDNNKSH